MDEKEIREILENCSAMTLAVEELSTNMPEIKKMYEDGKKMWMQIKKEEKQLENKTQESIKQVKDITNKNLDELKKTQRKVESIKNTLEVFDKKGLDIEELVKTVQEMFQYIKEQEKRIEEMEKKIESQRLEEKTKKTLKRVLEENHMQFPIKVHRKSWSEYYHFIVQEVKNGSAYGKAYNGNEFYRDDVFSLDNIEFELYKY